MSSCPSPLSPPRFRPASASSPSLYNRHQQHQQRGTGSANSTPRRTRIVTQPLPFSSLNLRRSSSAVAASGRAGGGGSRSSSPARGEGEAAALHEGDALIASRRHRVKVGVRCRPPFEDEVEQVSSSEDGRPRFSSHVHILPHRLPGGSTSKPPRLGRVRVKGVELGKQRDFYFDYTFGPKASQEDVYEDMAAPLVKGVLEGLNGTFFCYGQTGTGKTHTMGMLDALNDKAPSGVVPRAIASIFETLRAEEVNPPDDDSPREWVAMVSFLQIYQETIQDLLSPWALEGYGAELDNRLDQENLPVREDPHSGFYVEGLQEYIVRDAKEAMTLVNMGLARRAMAPTALNGTSSRSHTLLTLKLERRSLERRKGGARPTSSSRQQRPPIGEEQVDSPNVCTKRQLSKLVMVDLAGSERTGRASSLTVQGARVAEARSINSSLSALGNVIAALAEGSNAGGLGRQHIPYRDSKLTRLLQSSLGGTAMTALLGTIGPAASCVSETLSTLLFASRCMHVKIVPVRHEELDYARLCSRLQQELEGLRGEFFRKAAAQQDHYEGIIRTLQHQIKDMQDGTAGSDDQEGSTSKRVDAAGSSSSWSLPDASKESSPTAAAQSSRAARESQPSKATPTYAREEDARALEDAYEALCLVDAALVQALEEEAQRMEEDEVLLLKQLEEDETLDELRRRESELMANHDPARGEVASSGVSAGPHLTRLSRVEARTRVEALIAKAKGALPSMDDIEMQRMEYAAFSSLDDEGVVREMGNLRERIACNCLAISHALQRQSMACRDLKQDLVAQMLERRQREEEVVNCSFVLKYLLDSNSSLRRKVTHRRSPTPTMDNKAVAAISQETERDRTEEEQTLPLSSEMIPPSSESPSRVAKGRARKGNSGHRVQQAFFSEQRRESAVDSLPIGTKQLDRVIKKVMTLTPAEYNDLPPEAQQAVQELKKRLRQANRSATTVEL